MVLEVNESVLGSIIRQLWRYYDEDFSVESIEVIDEEERIYKIFGATEKSACETRIIKCKIFDDKIEDLYLHDGIDFIDPTTTVEEQEYR